MTGGQAVAALTFVGGVVAAGVFTFNALSAPDLTDVSGTAVAACETLASRPAVQVSTVEGEHLPGKASVSDTLGRGPCRVSFMVSDVPVHDGYVVTMGVMTATVSATVAHGGVVLRGPGS